MTRPARAALEAQLAAAETRRADRVCDLEDARQAWEEANEEVIAAEVALADLAKLEGPLFTPTTVDYRVAAAAVLDQISDRQALQ